MNDSVRRKRKRARFTHDPALVQLAEDAQVITREQVEGVVHVIGKDSAAADALERADEHRGPVRFWYSKSRGMLSVELIKDTRH